ncbi:MAG: FAD-dependent oxidoreductase [Nitrospirota bacterium]
MEFAGIILDTSSISPLKRPQHDTVYELLILGGGPAAMSAAVYAARKMINLALITQEFGGQVKETSEIENYLGFQSVNARDLITKFKEHVIHFDIPISLGISIIEVKKTEDIFTIHMEDGTTFSCRTVILATGERHRPLNVPGERELIGKGVAYCATCDAPLFKDKKVIVVGGANSAFTTTLDLLKVNAEVVLIGHSKGWKADEALQERVKSYKKVQFLNYYDILRIEGKDKVEAVVIQNRENQEEKKIITDGIFVEVGFLPNSGPIKNLVELNEKGEVIVDCLCRTNVPGFFAAGDVTSLPYKQIIISAGEGAKAALSAYDYLIKSENADIAQKFS